MELNYTNAILEERLPNNAAWSNVIELPVDSEETSNESYDSGMMSPEKLLEFSGLLSKTVQRNPQLAHDIMERFQADIDTMTYELQSATVQSSIFTDVEFNKLTELDETYIAVTQTERLRVGTYAL